MRRSKLFIRTRKDAPADEQAKNAQLLIRAGYIHKELAGVYAYLPLGVRVLENIFAEFTERLKFIAKPLGEYTTIGSRTVRDVTDTKPLVYAVICLSGAFVHKSGR